MTALDKAKRIVELSQRHKDEPVLICYGDAPEIAKLFLEAVELLKDCEECVIFHQRDEVRWHKTRLPAPPEEN